MKVTKYFLLFFFVICFAHCVDDEKSTRPVYDPSKPVEFSSFLPDSGGVSTQMVINGKNFGSDTSLIKVFVNGKKAPLIGSNGSSLLILIPVRADTGFVSVQIGKGTDIKEVVSNKKFNYIFKPAVSTLSGWTDANGKTDIVDGTLKTAQFISPYWLTFDQNKNIYLLEEFQGLRFIDLHNKTVTTKFRIGSGVVRPRTLAFSLTWDTLYVTNDQWDATGISTVILTKQTNYTKWNAIINSKTCNGSDVHPQTGDYFYTEYDHGFMYKWNKKTRVSEAMYRVDDVGWEFNVQFAPSGDFAYVVCVNKHYILKSNYNRETGKLEAPSVVCGLRATAGWQDGVGTGARFDQPHQGTFDEHDNFYVCDVYNHCIRKITPNGIVSTFAGRPQTPGYSDGTLRDAQFKYPRGIVYDKENQTFYIADQGNSRIRMITIE